MGKKQFGLQTKLGFSSCFLAPSLFHFCCVLLPRFAEENQPADGAVKDQHILPPSVHALEIEQRKTFQSDDLRTWH